MGNTLVLWPEVEVENSGSGCAHEIEIKPAPETRRSAARLTEAKLGNTLLETHRIQSGSRLADIFGTLLFHAVLVGGVLLLPLWYTDALDLHSFTRTMLVGPPPPPPPPSAAVATIKPLAAAQRKLFSSGKLLAPNAIPKKVVILKEEPIPADVDITGVLGGVPGPCANPCRWVRSSTTRGLQTLPKLSSAGQTSADQRRCGHRCSDRRDRECGRDGGSVRSPAAYPSRAGRSSRVEV